MVRIILIITLSFCVLQMVLLHTITAGVTTCADEEEKDDDLSPAKKLVLIKLNDAGNCNTFISA